MRKCYRISGIVLGAICLIFGAFITYLLLGEVLPMLAEESISGGEAIGGALAAGLIILPLTILGVLVQAIISIADVIVVAIGVGTAKKTGLKARWYDWLLLLPPILFLIGPIVSLLTIFVS